MSDQTLQKLRDRVAEDERMIRESQEEQQRAGSAFRKVSRELLERIEELQAQIDTQAERMGQQLLLNGKLQAENEKLRAVYEAAKAIEPEMCRDNPYFPTHQALVDAIAAVQEDK
jgi:regulator of replication initiation timing